MSASQIINILQSILTVLMTVVPPVLLALGCVTVVATGSLDCSAAVVSPKTLAWIVGGLGFVKLTLLPWFAPGGWIRNLFGDKTVVTPAPLIGTVSPTDKR